MPTLNRFPGRLLAGLTAICLCFMTCQSTVIAAHCGCEVGHHASPPAAPSCHCNCSHSKKTNCFQKAMKKMSAGIDKLLSFDNLLPFGKSNCDELLCDDACDAAMIEELRLPPAFPSEIDHHDHAAHDHGHSHEAHQHEDHQHEAHGQPLGTGQPQAPAAQASPSDKPAKPIAPPIRLKAAPSEPQSGSLFDIDAKPFDDSTRAPQYQPVRPSSFQEVKVEPIRTPDVPHQSQRSARNSR